MIGSVKRGSAHGVLTGIGRAADEPLRFVRMYDRNAIGAWKGDVFVFRSDKIAAAGKIEAVLAAMKISWPTLETTYDGSLK